MTELDARTAAEALQPVAASTPPADKPLDEHPPARLAEALALAVVKEQGLEGSALRRSSAELQGLLQNVVKRFQLQLAQERQRAQTSTELEQLLDGLAQTNSAAGRIIAKHRGKNDYDCIVPFSGGKDSTFTLYYLITGFHALHVIGGVARLEVGRPGAHHRLLDVPHLPPPGEPRQQLLGPLEHIGPAQVGENDQDRQGRGQGQRHDREGQGTAGRPRAAVGAAAPWPPCPGEGNRHAATGAGVQAATDVRERGLPCRGARSHRRGSPGPRPASSPAAHRRSVVTPPSLPPPRRVRFANRATACLADAPGFFVHPGRRAGRPRPVPPRARETAARGRPSRVRCWPAYLCFEPPFC